MLGKKKRVVKESKLNVFEVGDEVTKIKQDNNRMSYWERMSDGMRQRVHDECLENLDK